MQIPNYHMHEHIKPSETVFHFPFSFIAIESRNHCLIGLMCRYVVGIASMEKRTVPDRISKDKIKLVESKKS